MLFQNMIKFKTTAVCLVQGQLSSLFLIWLTFSDSWTLYITKGDVCTCPEYPMPFNWSNKLDLKLEWIVSLLFKKTNRVFLSKKICLVASGNCQTGN